MFSKSLNVFLYNIRPKFYSTTSNKLETHYDVLKVTRTSSTKEIKESFIKLSKENHPDVNNNKTSHANFLKINEAYKVLSKPESRRFYDLGLPDNRVLKETVYSHAINVEANPWNDPVFYHNRDKSKDKFHEAKPYYGINGMKRLPNSIIAGACFVFVMLTLSLQVIAIRHSFTFNRDHLLEQSKKATEALNKIKQEANENGNDLQLKILTMKFAGRDKE